MEVKGLRDTINWYNTNASNYASATENGASHDEIKKFVDLLPQNGKVLDAGCGAGRDTALLSKAGLRPVGIDLSSGLVKEAKKRHPELDFQEGSFLDLPFKNKTFDGVWAHASLLHLETVEDVIEALNEFNRVLKDEGVLHISVKAQTSEEKTAVVKDTLSNHDRFFQYFTQKELKELLGRTGFKVIKSEQYKETDKNPAGRSEVEWIVVLGKKLAN